MPTRNQDHDLLMVTATKQAETDRRVEAAETKLDRVERKVYLLMGAATLLQAAVKVWLNVRTGAGGN